ncbi:MAG: SGNH hydrolase domain-containing protein, partial [Actinomycetes bacterium]
VGSTGCWYRRRSAQIDPAAGYFSTFARAWQLALGAFIALTPAIAVRMKGKVASVSGLLGLGLLALALVVCGAEQGYPGWIALVPTGGAALLICAGLSETGRNPAGRLLSLRLPRAIGRISYSLYLWHWPLIIFAGVLYGKASTTAGARVGLLALSFVVATVSYFAIERPFIRLAHRPKESVGELPPVEEAEVGTARRDPADEDGPASGDGDGELSDAKRLEVERRRRIPKLPVAGMVAITAFSVKTIAALARPLPYADGILPPPGPEMSKARWERELDAAVKQKTVTKREALIAEAMVTRQLRGNIGGRGPTARSANRGGGRCPNRMTILNLEQARRCSRYGLGYGNFSWPKGVKPLVALVGNSFAGQWFYQLQRLLPKDVKLIPMSITGCRPWETGATGRLDSHGNSCDEHRNFVIRALRTEKPGLTVVSFQRMHPHQRQAAATGPFVSRIGRWSQGVLFLGPSPILIPLGMCLATSRQLSACNRRIKPTDWQLDRQDRRMVESAGGEYLSVQRLVCTYSICPAFVAGKPTRSDGIHLSRWSTRGISGFVSDALRTSARRAAARSGRASSATG